MALGKMLNLGGMENSLPKTAQTPNRFRVARNVQPSVDGRIIPRSSYETAAGQPTNIKRYEHLKEYNNSVFKMAVNSSDRYAYYLNNTAIPRSKSQGGVFASDVYKKKFSVMSFRKNNTLYVLNSDNGSFFKYDGVEITGCGSSQPRFECAQVTNTVQNKWVKVLQHRWDFDNIETISESVTFPILNATNSVAIRTDSLAAPIINTTNAFVEPQQLVTAVRADMDDLFFFGLDELPPPNTATYNPATEDYSINATETNITEPHQVGCYVIVANANTLAPNTYWSSTLSGVSGINFRLIAMKVKSVSPLVLDGRNVQTMEAGAAVWQLRNIRNNTFASNITSGGRKIFSVWASDTTAGSWVLRSTNLAFPESAISRTFTVDITTINLPAAAFYSSSVIPIIAGPFNLSATYAVTTRKLSLNTSSFTNTQQYSRFYGMTSYQDQILWWNNDLIYFSDPTLGGTVEMTTENQSSIRVGDSEYGDVVSCAGNLDYLVVSRERKNYFISGNLETANYRFQEIADIEIGAWCNNGTISIKDSVILINATGVWQIQGGGRTSFLGQKIPKNFAIYDGFSNTDDVSFKLSGFSTFPVNFNDLDTGLDITFDEYRGYLIFCQRATPTTPVLLLHTKTGEFYEWDGLEAAGLRSMAFVRGILYFGTIDNAGSTAIVRSEMSSVNTQDYAGNYPIKLYSTWLTGGEPSLEKQLLQLKMFGVVNTNLGNSINVVHFKDWQLTKVTNSPYIPDSATQFSHLKRLNSDKVLATSVGFEVVSAGVTFEIESFEVEFNPIQQGIKR